MNTSLSAFPLSLLRLILCGSGGLAPAWGPIKDALGMTWPWDPHDEDIAWPPGCPSGTRDIWCQPPLSGPQQWVMPLDAESPWPARLALVAAWLLGVGPVVAARILAGTPSGIVLVFWPTNVRNDTSAWWFDDGTNGYRGPNLPTLPQHLQTHPPAVALVLALWDVPEIRARIEAP